MPDNSFDIVSKIELPEVSNAVQQAVKEIEQRYDLKGSHSSIELREKENKIFLQSQDEFKLKAVTDVLEAKLVKRKVPLKGLVFGTIIPSAGSTVRQEITLQQGIAIEKARDIVKAIKDSKKKVQASIQGDFVRVAGKDRDALQEVMAVLRAADFGIDMQFVNYRTNEKPAACRLLCLEESNPYLCLDQRGGWRPCSKSRKKVSRRRPPWSVTRIRYTAARCTTKWSTASLEACAAPEPWCCASTIAAST